MRGFHAQESEKNLTDAGAIRLHNALMSNDLGAARGVLGTSSPTTADPGPKTSRRLSWWVVGVVALGAFAASCVATQTAVSDAQRSLGLPGFWKGFWHGCIAPITFFVSIFSDHVRIYAAPNSGLWYDLGFMLGIGGFSHGVHRGGAASSRRRQRRLEEANT